MSIKGVDISNANGDVDFEMLKRNGINFRIYYCFGMIITIWLIINELISILENLGELKIPLPKFLVNTIKSLKGRVEDKVNNNKDTEE